MRHSLRRSFYRAARIFVDIAKRGYHSFDPVRRGFVSLQPDGVVRGRVLIAHKVEAFLRSSNDPLLRTHNHFTEARLLADAFLENGYAVDFIHFENRWFLPRKDYDIFLGPRINFECLAEKMPAGCIKVVHLDTAHWLYNNTAALLRLQEVQRRRGVALSSYTGVKANRAIEVADYATMLGNEFTYETYAFAGKPIFQVPNPVMALHPWSENKNFQRHRNHFLWLGSSGLVHKGLDIVLESFSRMPNLRLTVCGPVEQDRHFVNAFREELYETPNITTFGWVDTTGPEFSNLANSAVAHIYPTCAEGSSGAVINCMQAGLIPITTRQAGVDIDPSFGLRLSEPTMEAVMTAAQELAEFPPDRLAAMAKRSHVEAQQLYSPDRYKAVLSAFIERVIRKGVPTFSPRLVKSEEMLSFRSVIDEHT